MDGAGVRLQVEHKLFAGNRFRGKQHVTVIHVHALHGHVVHKQQKLRVFAVVPFDLRAHIQPHCLAVKRFRHGEFRAEPIVLVRAVPMHGAAVKRRPRRRSGICCFGANIRALFADKVGQRNALHDAQTVKLITNALHTFIEIPHSCNSFSISVWGFVKTGAFDLILA